MFKPRKSSFKLEGESCGAKVNTANSAVPLSQMETLTKLKDGVKVKGIYRSLAKSSISNGGECLCEREVDDGATINEVMITRYASLLVVMAKER